ncbi:LIM domain-containing protein D [Papilio xuthus]|uniref:LIM domain-containing protein D n=1 Tax=Papilio xuthus TaxID=66420 RepID=A0A194QCL7_PAPXU|nr:LIM domain-containing protein D [Papilio xuthus]
MYRPNFYESTCFRCNEIVYQVDRVGPLKDFTFFHSGCFKCAVCGTKLTLKTYYNNQHWTEDKEVYCSSHVPKIGPGHLDNSSVGIRSALNVPRTNNYVNEQIRGHARNSHDNDLSPTRATNGGSVHASPARDVSREPDYQYGRFDASALHIAHALKQTELQKAYHRPKEKPIDCYLTILGKTQIAMSFDHCWVLGNRDIKRQNGVVTRLMKTQHFTIAIVQSRTNYKVE